MEPFLEFPFTCTWAPSVARKMFIRKFICIFRCKVTVKMWPPKNQVFHCTLNLSFPNFQLESYLPWTNIALTTYISCWNFLDTLLKKLANNLKFSNTGIPYKPMKNYIDTAKNRIFKFNNQKRKNSVLTKMSSMSHVSCITKKRWKETETLESLTWSHKQRIPEALMR